MGRRTNLRKLPRQRRRMDPALPPVPANIAVSGSGQGATTGTARITFAGVMNLSGQSSIATYSGGAFTLSQATPNVVVLTPTTPATVVAKTFTIPSNDPAFRSPTGGFAVPTALTFS